MTQVTVLKLVDSLPFTVEEDSSLLAGGDRPHSLHGIVAQPRQTNPDLAAYLIDTYSEKDDVLADPFCGSGTIALEACMRGRKIFASDVSELQTTITAAKLAPADIAEVTLKLQMLGLERPVSTDSYQEYFAPFYDLDTFRELSNLRKAICAAEDRVSRYISALSLGLLHGHSGGYFSAYTNPKVSLLPNQQEELNTERGQYTDYRSVIPRIIKRAAGIGRDGIPSILHKMERESLVRTADATNLAFIPSGSVDFLLTNPPQLREVDPVNSSWLRLWFARIDSARIASSVLRTDNVDSWLDYMNGVLLEAARIVKPGGRAAFCLAAASGKDGLDSELKAYVEDQFFRFWEAESLFVAKTPVEKLAHAQRSRNGSKAESEQRVLILRRR